MTITFDNQEYSRGTVIEVDVWSGYGHHCKTRHAIVLSTMIFTGEPGTVRFHIVLMGLSKFKVYKYTSETGFRVDNRVRPYTNP